MSMTPRLGGFTSYAVGFADEDGEALLHLPGNVRHPSGAAKAACGEWTAGTTFFMTANRELCDKCFGRN